jgi:uncharacterized circularly permuted ATP-grasp superfamily protein
MPNLLPELNPKGWDEMFSDDGVRHSYRQVLHTLENLNLQSLHDKQKQASDFFMNQGITSVSYTHLRAHETG